MRQRLSPPGQVGKLALLLTMLPQAAFAHSGPPVGLSAGFLPLLAYLGLAPMRLKHQTRLPLGVAAGLFVALGAAALADSSPCSAPILRDMNRTELSYAVTAIAMSVITGLAVRACSAPDLTETWGEKTEWSVLQGTEFQERDHALAAPVIRVVGSHEVLGVRSASGPNVWILLKVESPPYYKQMPELNYELPATLVDQLVKEHRMSYTVEHVLRAHTAPR